MPIFVMGGGAGGSFGVKYPPGNVKNIDISKVSGDWVLTWEDPDNVLIDDKYLAEWKGTIVVKNTNNRPISATDGEAILVSTTKNQYKTTGYNLGNNATSCYYGVFPYTKGGVYNVSEANTVYLPSEGYEGSLENATWNDVIWAAEQKTAQDIWTLGEKIVLQLSGEYYNFDVNMKIIGFNHDNLVGGGKANITFMSDDIFVINDSSQIYYYSSGGTYRSNPKNYVSTIISTEIFKNIKSCIPGKILKNIKSVYKERISDYTIYKGDNTSTDGSMIYYVGRYARDLFGFSAYEVGLGKVPGTYEGKTEGMKYEIFGDDNSRKKESLIDSTKEWWLESGRNTRTSTAGATVTFFVGEDGSSTSILISDYNANNIMQGKGVVFGFCI